MVNVVGTVNVFESAKQVGSVKSIVYASSAGVCGPPEDYRGVGKPVLDSDHHSPRTHYGFYKLCNEGKFGKAKAVSIAVITKVFSIYCFSLIIFNVH